MDIERIMAEDNENENQVLKNEFSENVKEYLALDEQIARLNKALKERRTKIKELSTSIMKAMTLNDIEHINIKNGSQDEHQYPLLAVFLSYNLICSIFSIICDFLNLLFSNTLNGSRAIFPTAKYTMF